MDLLDLVLKAHLDGGGGDDWKFCLLASSILSEIAMKNAIKGKHFHRNMKLSSTERDHAYIQFFHAKTDLISLILIDIGS